MQHQRCRITRNFPSPAEPSWSQDPASRLLRSARVLRALGATVVEIPAIAIVAPESYAPLDAALGNLHTYDWLIVTSANAARVLGERRQALGLSWPVEPATSPLTTGDAVAGRPQTVAVGPATAAALRQVGLRVDLIPQPAVAESIVAALKDQVAGLSVLLARAESARDLIPLALAQAGARLTVVDAYRTIVAPEAESLVRATFHAEATQPPQVDGLTFTSSSTVKNLFALLQSAGAGVPAGAKIFSIGPITSQTLREHGLEPDREATRHDVEGLIAAVVEGLGRDSPNQSPEST